MAYRRDTTRGLRGPPKKVAKLFPGDRRNRVKAKVLRAMINGGRTAWTVGLVAERADIHPENARAALLKLARYKYVRRELLDRRPNGQPRRYIYIVTARGRDLWDAYQDRIKMGRTLGIEGQLTLTLNEKIPNNVRYAADKIETRAKHMNDGKQPTNEQLEQARITWIAEHPAAAEHLRTTIADILKQFPNWPQNTTPKQQP